MANTKDEKDSIIQVDPTPIITHTIEVVLNHTYEALVMFTGFIVPHLIRYIRKRLNLNTPKVEIKISKKFSEELNYHLIGLLKDTNVDGVLLGFPVTEYEKGKLPVQSVKWSYKADKPNFEVQPPEILPSELSLKASDEWVFIESYLGEYYYKTLFYEGLVVCYIMLYDTNEIVKTHIENVNTKPLENFIKTNLKYV